MRKRSPDSWGLWLYASSTAHLDAGTRELADILKLPGGHDPQTRVFRLVEAWLRGSVSQLLFVLDNVDLEDTLFKPTESTNVTTPGAASNGSIDFLAIPSYGQTVLTTRYKKVALRSVNVCEIIAIGPMLT
jgi:hypothetical protein